jgi:hypothetical protein
VRPRLITPGQALALHDAGGPPHQDVLEVIDRRGIEEVLHFTTNTGLVGALGVGQLLSRARLPSTRYLEHVYKPNSSTRKDLAWLDFVNLSITNINEWMFTSSKAWHSHEDLWWACLSFQPTIMAEPGVVFTTTNNIYPSVLRSDGVDGLEQAFAPIVRSRFGQRLDRSRRSLAQPTDRQAEVLIPHSVALNALQAIYIRQEEHADDIHGIFACLPDAEVPVEVRPEVFQ